MECIHRVSVPPHMYVIVYDGAIGDPSPFAQENGGWKLQPRGSRDLDRRWRRKGQPARSSGGFIQGPERGRRASTYAKEVSDTSPVVECAFDSALSPT